MGLDPSLPLWLWVGFLGLCVGSFLNVVIHRLPIMMARQERAWAHEMLTDDGDDDAAGEATSPQGVAAEPAHEGRYDLMVPRSACPNCGHRITAIENIPVLSWLALRGRCRGCRAPISPRYPIIELLTCILTLVDVHLFGFTWTAAWVVLFTWALVAAAMIDVDHQLLPDSIVLPLLWLGLLVNLDGRFVGLDQAVIGAVAGYLALWSLYWAFRLLTGKEGMGYGDFKLLAAMGAWMGWMTLPGIALLSSLAGLVGAGALMLTGHMARGTPMPFGPFIAVAGWLAMVLPAAGLGVPGL
ncbi:MAG TPA: A24 family peptidase [Pseudomonadales bacterium]|nr:A24 family peptidase [Pseudomonadales bacterium]